MEMEHVFVLRGCYDHLVMNTLLRPWCSHAFVSGGCYDQLVIPMFCFYNPAYLSAKTLVWKPLLRSNKNLIFSISRADLLSPTLVGTTYVHAKLLLTNCPPSPQSHIIFLIPFLQGSPISCQDPRSILYSATHSHHILLRIREEENTHPAKTKAEISS